MLMPLYDDNSEIKIKPIVNYVLIIINVLVFILLQGMGSNDSFTYGYSTVPAEIIMGKDIVTHAQTIVDQATGQSYILPGLNITNIPVYFTLFTSMFMHGGWGHLLGNMLYLFIFGDNIENRLGHKKYLFFYLICGVIAALSHVLATYFFHQNSLMPSLGASGAISGVMGAYIHLFPQKKVRSLVLVFIIPIPAYITLGLWIAFQIVSGLGVIGGSEGGGVAYAAHIGGFIAGYFLIKYFDKNSQIE